MRLCMSIHACIVILLSFPCCLDNTHDNTSTSTHWSITDVVKTLSQYVHFLVCCGNGVASFPGLPTIQFWSFVVRKNEGKSWSILSCEWRQCLLGNEASIGALILFYTQDIWRSMWLGKFFIHAVPRLNITSIETMVTFQFDGTPLLRLSIQVIECSGDCNKIHSIIREKYALTYTSMWTYC